MNACTADFATGPRLSDLSSSSCSLPRVVAYAVASVRTLPARLLIAADVSPACLSTAENSSSTRSFRLPKLVFEVSIAVPSAFTDVPSAPERSLTPVLAAERSSTPVFADARASAMSLFELASSVFAESVSDEYVRSTAALSFSMPARSAMLPLNDLSRCWYSGLSSMSSMDEARFNAVSVSVFENVWLIVAAMVSAPWPVTFGASALSFSLL